MRSYKPKMRRRGSGSSLLGMTLVEILVVLVILIFGILSVIRLFPGGFSVIRSTENNASALRLGQSLLETLKQSPGSIPEAVYVGFMYNNGPSSVYAEYFDPDTRLDDFSPYKLKAGAVPLYANLYHDLDKARYISNETVAIPAVRPGALMSVYLLNFGPIVMDASLATNPATNSLAPLMTVSSTPWTARTADSTLVPPIDNSLSPPRMHPKDEPSEELHAGRPEFLVDYVNGQIAVPQYLDTAKSYDQYFLFTVKVGGVQQTLHLFIPKFTSGGSNTSTSYYGDWFSPGDATLNYEQDSPQVPLPANTWDDGSATLIRTFIYKPMANSTVNPFNGDLDPYEFTLVSTLNIPTKVIPGTVACLGVVGFSPLAAGQNGVAPITARISYNVFDWHVIHEDHDVPPSGEGTAVPLILKRIKKLGDVDKDSAMYTGLFDSVGIPSLQNKFDVVVVDRDTGDSYTNGYDLADAVPPYPVNQIGVSYQAGYLRFPNGFANQHTHFRVYYAAKDDWAVALQKAPINYVPDNDLTAPADMTRYYPPINRFTQVNGSSSTTSLVSFPLCDAGMQVRFDTITYTKAGSATSLNPAGTPVVQHGVLLPISSDLSRLTNLPYIDLAQQLGDVETAIDPSTGFPFAVKISGISGVSVQAVVIWRERDQWKRQPVDTLLLPK